MFTKAQVVFDLAYYFRLCHDMKWDLFAAYLITEIAVAADFFEVALDQLENADLSVYTTLTQIKVFQSLLTTSIVEENPLNVFSIASMLVKKSAPDLTERTEQLLMYALHALSQDRLNTSDYFENLFQNRVALFGIDSIPFRSDLLKESLIKEVAFKQVKINFHDPKLQKLSLHIILC